MRAMYAPNMPTVWILGAGFSRSLGAPLFRDLFQSNHCVRAACAGNPPEGMIGVLELYRRHTPLEMGGTGATNGVFWRDPEEFLEFVGAGKAGSIREKELLGTDPGHVTMDAAVDMGTRALALECSHFLRGADLNTERWLPYVMWASNRTAQDTIITFNYDRVPELLGENVNCPYGQPRLKVILPKSSDEAKIEMSLARRTSAAPVLKLHGSVDWLAKNGRIELAPSGNVAFSEHHPLLAMPGPRKSSLQKELGSMAALWAAGLEAIRNAQRIVFVGYRFPPTDAEARLQILGAIKSNNALPLVEIVLGPDLTAPDVARMSALVDIPPPQKVIRPLWAEDFLGT